MKVLVVDNEPDIVEMLTYWLERHGCEVVSTMSGLCAVSLAHQEMCEVVLLDVMLPDVSGLTVLPEIVATSPRARVIMMSAVHREFWEDEALQNGAEYCIRKPINLIELEQILYKARSAS